MVHCEISGTGLDCLLLLLTCVWLYHALSVTDVHCLSRSTLK